MKKFIMETEKHFDARWHNVMDKGISLLLTPAESAEVIHLYLRGKDKTITRDIIMFKIAELSLYEISALFKKIKKEVSNYCQKNSINNN